MGLLPNTVSTDHRLQIILWIPISDVLGLAWPESLGFGLALPGLGLANPQAKPSVRAWAWLGLGLA